MSDDTNDPTSTPPTNSPEGDPPQPSNPDDAPGGENKPTPEEKPGVDPIQDLDKEVTKQTQKAKEVLQKLDPNLQKEVKEYMQSEISRAVNDALRAQQEKGKVVPAEEIQRIVREETERVREEMQRQTAARENLYEMLAKHGVAPGSEGWKKFTEEYKKGFYRPDALTTEAGVERILKAAGVLETGESATTAANNQNTPVHGPTGKGMYLGLKKDGGKEKTVVQDADPYAEARNRVIQSLGLDR